MREEDPRAYSACAGGFQSGPHHPSVRDRREARREPRAGSATSVSSPPACRCFSSVIDDAAAVAGRGRLPDDPPPATQSRRPGIAVRDAVMTLALGRAPGS